MNLILLYILGILRESFILLSAMSPYLLLGFGVAGLLHIFIPAEKVYSHLGGGGIVPMLKAVIFGAPLPLCSCGVIPVAASLRRDGASKSATLSFLVATPTTGVDSILATFALMGPLFAIFRPIAAVLGGLAVGITAAIVLKKENVHKHTDVNPQVKNTAKISIVKKLREAAEYGYGELISDIGKTLLWAVLVGGIISFLLPATIVGKYLGSPISSFLIMLVIAIPMYVCATGSIPIAAALIAKGMNPGAALVFLVAGPATNTITIAVVAKQLGKKAAVLYVISIVAAAIVMGFAFNLLWKALGASTALITPAHDAGKNWLGIASAILLLLLILRGLFAAHKHNKIHLEEDVRYRITVGDMTCNHCQATIERAVGEIAGVEKVVVSLDDKLVFVDGDVSGDKIVEAIKNAGYTPENLKEQK